MSDHTMSSNLLSASLFDVAYSMDTAKNEVNAIYWLFKFCAIALMFHRYRVHDIVPDVNDDSKNSLGMFQRTELVMDYVEHTHRDDQASMHAVQDAQVVARSITKLLGLQLGEEARREYQEVLGNVEAAVSSTLLLRGEAQDRPPRLS